MIKYKLTFKGLDTDSLASKVYNFLKSLGYTVYNYDGDCIEYVNHSALVTEGHITKLWVDYEYRSVEKVKGTMEGVGVHFDEEGLAKLTSQELKFFDSLDFETSYRQSRDLGQDITDWWAGGESE